MLFRYSSAFKAKDSYSQNLSPKLFLDKLICLMPNLETSRVFGCLKLSLYLNWSLSSYCEQTTFEILETCLSFRLLHWRSKSWSDLLFIIPSVKTCRKSVWAMLLFCKIRDRITKESSTASPICLHPDLQSLNPTRWMTYSFKLCLICSAKCLINHMFSNVFWLNLVFSHSILTRRGNSTKAFLFSRAVTEIISLQNVILSKNLKSTRISPKVLASDFYIKSKLNFIWGSFGLILIIYFKANSRYLWDAVLFDLKRLLHACFICW